MKPLSVLAPIKPDALDRLTAALDAVYRDLSGNPYLQLGKSRTTHFARMLIIDDPQAPAPLRLMYACNYDGTLYDYINELLAISPDPDALWGCCEGYTSAQPEEFAWFIRRYVADDVDVFIGFPSTSVERVRSQIQIRSMLEQFLNLKDVQQYLADPEIQQLLALLDQIAPPPAPLQRLWSQCCGVLGGLGHALHQVALGASLWFAEQYGKIGMNPNFSRVPDECVSLPVREAYLNHQIALEGMENRYIQNQMTVYAPIKPGLFYQVRLRLAMFLAAAVITYGWPPGEFSGVYTLHSFSWLLIDKGTRLIFMSNFDNSAQNYLGDFLDHLNWALNVFYNNCVGYPEGGMLQVDQFYQWVRSHQIPPLVYYSAYPHETVLNIMRDQQITQPLIQSFDRDALTEWLRAL